MTIRERISLEIKVTERCNQHCLFCMNDDGTRSNGRDLPFARITRRIDEWSAERERARFEIGEIRMTGGEPLLALEGVLALARSAHAIGIRSGINTNGLLLDDDTAARLGDAGLGTVKISLDALTPSRLRQLRGPAASGDRAQRALALAVRSGFHVIARFTLCSLNRDELVPCFELADALGVEVFQVKPMIRAGRARSTRVFLERSALREAFEELARAASGAVTKAQVLCWPKEEAAGLDTKACGSLDKLYVATDGRVTLCNFIEDDRALGNLTNEPLAPIVGRRELDLVRGAYSHVVPRFCPQWRSMAGDEPGTESLPCCAT